MSDESFRPEPADRPAATIWDHYAQTRRLVSLLCATVSGYGLFHLLILSILWLLELGRYTPSTALESPVIVFLIFMTVQGALGFGLYRGHFGLGRTAVTVTAIAAVVWLATVAWLAFKDSKYVTSGLAYSHDVYLLFAIGGFPFVLFAGMIFFMAYLLWRTNNEG